MNDESEARGEARRGEARAPVVIVLLIVIAS